MAYNYGFPVNYQPMYPQQQNQINPVYQPQQQVPVNSLTWVQGESGAKSYMVPANGTVLLMDSESDQFFLKSTDASGMPLPLRTFRYSEITHENAPKIDSKPKDEEIYVTKEELAKFKREMVQMIKKEEENEQLTI